MTPHDAPLFSDESERMASAMPASDGTPWRQGWDLTEEEIAFFRERSNSSREAKRRALNGEGPTPLHSINTPRLDPADLMPRMAPNGLRSLSLFSGGGGLDLGFDLAGFEHAASYDILLIAGETLRKNRPGWTIFAGEAAGNVCGQDWGDFRGKVDVIQGGPPCQPFSMAGRQLGSADTRDMIPEFVRAVLACRPRAFVAENVAALGQAKFRSYLEQELYRPLSGDYRIERFELRAEWFGVPQQRVRLFFVGFRNAREASRFAVPEATHCSGKDACASKRPDAPDLFAFVQNEDSAMPPKLRTMGVREALGLPDIGFDDLAPTLRSGFTGPRGATSVNSSTAALRTWGKLGIWPHGVAVDRASARLFVPENGHFRLSLQDCALLQGFPENWSFAGPVYAVLGQIGNSVAPPMAYGIALAVARSLSST